MATAHAQLSEGELVRLHLSGDWRAFTALHDRYAPRLKKFAFKIVGNREEAEDIVQDTFVRVAKHAHNFDQSKVFSTWIYTITANLSKNFLRNTGRRQTTSIDRMQDDCEEARGKQFESEEIGPHELCCIYDVMEMVRIAVGELPPEQQQVLINRDVDGMTYNEIAIYSNIPQGTVKSRLFRARESVASRLRRKRVHGAH